MNIAATSVTAAVDMSRTRRWAILGAMLLGTTLAVLDSSILNISAVPVMDEFRTDLRTVEWVLTSYNLTFAVFMIGLDDSLRRRCPGPVAHDDG